MTTLCRLSALMLGSAFLVLSMDPAYAKGAADFRALYEMIPARADAFVAVDHERLARHPASSKLRAFIHEQGGAKGLEALTKMGLESGKQILRSVSFNIGVDDADIVTGPLGVKDLQARAKATLKDAYSEGDVDDALWFTIGQGRRLVILSDTVALVARTAMVKTVLARALAKKGKALSSKPAFKKVSAHPARSKASIWGGAWASKRLKKLTKGKIAEPLRSIVRTGFYALGESDVTIQGTFYTEKKADAEALKVLVEGELSQRFNSLTMKMLGVSALVSGIALKVKGKALLATLELTPAQVDLVTTSGGKVISILRAKRKR